MIQGETSSTRPALRPGRIASYRIHGDSGELEHMEIYEVGKTPVSVLTLVTD